LKVEQWAIEDVIPYHRNPRKNDAAVAAVAKSIQTFGFRQPIVVDSDGVIIVGHTRLKAAQLLGMTEVPVHVAHDLTPEQVRAYRLADNKSGSISTWDNKLLAGELVALDYTEDGPATDFEPAEDPWTKPVRQQRRNQR
jgi:ParB-like chromosome segregation protein Spo0J